MQPLPLSTPTTLAQSTPRAVSLTSMNYIEGIRPTSQYNGLLNIDQLLYSMIDPNTKMFILTEICNIFNAWKSDKIVSSAQTFGFFNNSKY